MASVETLSIDGIRTFRADSEGDDSSIGVFFRVGPHDEDFSTAGLTALAARMVIASLPVDVRDHVDTWGNGVFTHFSIATDRGDAMTTLRRVADAINNIRWDRLEQQKTLLQTMDGVEGLVGAAHLFHRRYGPIGPGTAWIKKAMYTAAQPEHVQRWIERYFVRENAVITVVGDMPSGISFPIPTGERHDFLLLEPVHAHLPARVELEADENAVGLQMTAPLTATTSVAFAILSDTLHRRLVTLESLTPDLVVDMLMLDANVASFTAVFPVHPKNMDAAIKALLETVEDIANGMVNDDLFEYRRIEAAEASAHAEAYWAVEQAAQSALFPAVQTLEARFAEADGLTRSEVGEVVRRAAQDTLLIATPSRFVGAADKLPLFTPVAVTPITGTTARLMGPMRVLARHTKLVFSDEGLTLTDRAGVTTIRFDQVVAVVDNTISITVVDRSGDTLTLHDSAWSNNKELRAAVGRAVTPDRWITLPPSEEDLATRDAIRDGVKAFTGWRLIFPIALLVFLGLNTYYLVFGSSEQQVGAFLRLIMLTAILTALTFLQKRGLRKRRGPHRH